MLRNFARISHRIVIRPNILSVRRVVDMMARGESNIMAKATLTRDLGITQPIALDLRPFRKISTHWYPEFSIKDGYLLIHGAEEGSRMKLAEMFPRDLKDVIQEPVMSEIQAETEIPAFRINGLKFELKEPPNESCVGR